jgi:hypothetical protein
MPDNGQPKATPLDWVRTIIVSVTGVGGIICSILVIWGAGTPIEKLKLATGYAALIFLFLLSMIFLLDLVTNKINLSQMLEELDGGASLSRFQLLVFTFVVGFSFFVVVANNKEGKLPEIPNNVLALLGVSASTYAVSKGLQVSSGKTSPDPESPKPTEKPAPVKTQGTSGAANVESASGPPPAPSAGPVKTTPQA